MGSLGSTASDDSRCCLPTSGHEPASNPTWRHITVRVPDCKEFSDFHPGKTLLDANAILRSWAVLLRCYTGTDLVSFARLYHSHIAEANNERAGPDTGGVGDAIRILQYQLSDSLELQHISEDDSHIHGKTTTERTIVNTAVYIFEDFCTCSDANFRQTFSKIHARLTNLDHVGGLFSILIISDGKRSLSLALFVFLSSRFCQFSRI